MTNSTLTFPMRPYMGQDETPTSYASRFAAVNGFPSLLSWCSLVGHSAYDIASGKEETLHWLASLDSAAQNQFKANVLKGMGDCFHLNDVMLRKADLRRLRLQVCPRCIAADLEISGYPEHVRPFQRVWWCLAAIRSCPDHHVALVELDTDDAMVSMGGVDFTVALRRHLPWICKAAPLLAACPPSPREDYLLARLRKMPGAGFDLLDAMPFHAVVRACEVVGSVARSGPYSTIGEVGADESYDIADQGFDILAAGAEGLESLMEAMVGRVLADAKARWGIRPMLGQLHDAFSHRNADPGFDPIRRVVSRFVMRTMPLGPENNLFGSPIGERVLHSIRSAAEATGMHPKTLRRHLATHGVIPSLMRGVTDERVVFPVEALKELPDANEKVLDLAKLGRHLSIPRVHLAAIGRSDLIEAVRKPDAHGAAKFGYAIGEIVRFQNALFAGAVEVEAQPPGTADLVTVRKRTCRQIIEILELASTDGGLKKKFCLANRRDYGALLLDVEEVKAALVGEDHGGVPIYRVAALLGTGATSAKRMMDDGIIPVRVARNPVNRCEQRIVDRQAIQEFRQKYVSLSELANELRKDRGFVTQMMRSFGIEPAFDAKRIGATFFERTRLPSM